MNSLAARTIFLQRQVRLSLGHPSVGFAQKFPEAGDTKEKLSFNILTPVIFTLGFEFPKARC